MLANIKKSHFIFHFRFQIFRHGSPSVRENLFTEGHAIKYGKTKVNILHKIKQIDNLITIVKRNLKNNIKNGKGGFVDSSRTEDHFMAFIKSFKVDVFLVFLDKPIQSFAPW